MTGCVRTIGWTLATGSRRTWPALPAARENSALQSQQRRSGEAGLIEAAVHGLEALEDLLERVAEAVVGLDGVDVERVAARGAWDGEDDCRSARSQA